MHEIYPVLSHCIQGAKNQQTKVMGHKSKIKQKKAWLYFENLMDCWSLNESPLFFFQCDKQLKTVKAEKNKWSKEWIWKGKSQ